MSFKFQLYLASIIIFILSALSHFVYTWSKNKFLGLFFPLNESVWEHKKLVILPILLVMSCLYFINMDNLDKDKFFFSTFIMLIICSELIPIIFYFYTSSLGIEKVLIDIFITYLCILISTIAFIHIYNHMSFSFNFIYSIALYLLIIIIYGILTYKPLKLPIFKDNSLN